MLDLDAPKGEQGRGMMLESLRGYFGWKAYPHASVNPSIGGNNRGVGKQTRSSAVPGEGDLN